MFLTKTYSIEDCINYDAMTSNSGKWTIPSACSTAYDSNGCKFGTATSYSQVKLTNKLTSACTVEFTLVDYYTSSSQGIGDHPVVIYQLHIFYPAEEGLSGIHQPGRFSFNISGGRCEVCKGNGYKTVEMNFLPDVLVPCEECGGKRYNRETLEVKFKGKSIADVLDMTINQAVEFFDAIPAILGKIKVLQDVGLGYIKLGQPSSTLSGGESQRVKLAAELSKKDTGRTVYILDEPTTGLHFEDIKVLLSVLNRLVEKGNTVIVIEHNMDVIKCADYIIDMGPEGGRGGGQVVACGTPEQVARSKKSITARYLKQELKR